MKLSQAVEDYLQTRSTVAFQQVERASLQELSRFLVCADYDLEVARKFVSLIQAAELVPDTAMGVENRRAMLCLCYAVIVNRSNVGEESWKALSEYLSLLQDDEFVLGDVPAIRREVSKPIPVVYPNVLAQVAKLSAALLALPSGLQADWLENTLRRLRLLESEFGRNALKTVLRSGRPVPNLLCSVLGDLNFAVSGGQA